jgi:hypothetical protein
MFDGIDAVLTDDLDKYKKAINTIEGPPGRLLGSQYLIPLPAITVAWPILTRTSRSRSSMRTTTAKPASARSADATANYASPATLHNPSRQSPNLPVQKHKRRPLQELSAPRVQNTF